jgi:hypothetical protein
MYNEKNIVQAMRLFSDISTAYVEELKNYSEQMALLDEDSLTEYCEKYSDEIDELMKKTSYIKKLVDFLQNSESTIH